MDAKEKRKQHDIKFISNPNNWGAYWPFLPVKRYVVQYRPPECASLIQIEDPEDKEKMVFGLFNTTVFDDMSNLDVSKPNKIYKTAEEVVADGWMVD